MRTKAVHPHGCGEHAIYQPGHGQHARFIPTGVGNTDHQKQNDKQIPGSSPRVWGTPRRFISPASPMRFIPTGVGNTVINNWEMRYWTVHPHGCGEHGQ